MPDTKKRRTDEELAFNTVVGRNIKYLRKLRNLNQTKVAYAVKVKFQQLQKYEKGFNACSSYRLDLLAKFFKVGMDVLADPEMIIKHTGFASYQEQNEGVGDDQIKMVDQEHFNRQLNK